jgi:hypothetical protein
VNSAAAPNKSEQQPGAGLGLKPRGVLFGNPGASLIILAAFISFVLSVVLWFANSREEALFTGLWVPSILALGGFYAALQSRSA